MAACLEWWNSNNIRCSFETGHWTQIPQAFPTLLRMLMSRIQHLRTRLPVHIGFVPVRKPGQETKERNHQNHQSTTQADTQDRNSSANAQQCSNIYDGRPMSFRRPLLPIWRLRVGSPSFTTDRWNIRVSQLKTSSREKFLSSHDIHSSCHIACCYLKHQGNQAYFHTKGQRSHNIQAMAATILDSPGIRSQPQSQKCKNIEKHQKN